MTLFTCPFERSNAMLPTLAPKSAKTRKGAGQRGCVSVESMLPRVPLLVPLLCYTYLYSMTTSIFTARNILHDFRLVNEALAANNWKAVSDIDDVHIAGLRNLLSIQQGMICAGCGETLIGQRVELCHIVSGRKGKGVCNGNVYAGCKECNDYDRTECGGNAETIIDRMVRPDLVATSGHPTRKVARGAAVSERRITVNSKRNAMVADIH